MIHLTAAGYRHMPWANGRGTTVELLREDGPDGLLLRLSMASVTEDAAFSVFPGIERNLTVISGPGFRLDGAGLSLDCLPLVPVAFPGDVPLRATGTAAGASEDFNVMTAWSLPRPIVTVEQPGARLGAGGMLYLFALNDTAINGRPVQRLDLLITDGNARIDGPCAVIAVRLTR